MPEQTESHLEAERMKQLWAPSFDGMECVRETDKRYEYESETHFGHINKNGWGAGKGNKMSKEFWQQKEAKHIERIRKLLAK